jgi:hypothetical protein
MKTRRIVTGHSPTGHAIIASETEVDDVTVAIAPNAKLNVVWGGDSAPVFPDDGSLPQFSTYFPPIGGFRFVLFTVLPQSSVTSSKPLDMEAALKEAEEKFPGLLSHMELDNPGMHRSDTIDLVYVVSGEIWLELDNALEVRLCAGDTLVENGTRHAWHNRGLEPCHMVVNIIGAHHQSHKS